jgi:hypothetical protein
MAQVRLTAADRASKLCRRVFASASRHLPLQRLCITAKLVNPSTDSKKCVNQAHARCLFSELFFGLLDETLSTGTTTNWQLCH